jgi:site-specific recombinase XerD
MLGTSDERVRMVRGAAAAQRLFQRIGPGAGVRPFTMYTLRHTFASHLVMAGVPLPVVQQLMGHSSVTMTMRYAHLAPSAMTAAVQALEGVRAWQHFQVFGQPVGNHVPSGPVPGAVAAS